MKKANKMLLIVTEVEKLVRCLSGKEKGFADCWYCAFGQAFEHDEFMDIGKDGIDPFWEPFWELLQANGVEPKPIQDKIRQACSRVSDPCNAYSPILEWVAEQLDATAETA